MCNSKEFKTPTIEFRYNLPSSNTHLKKRSYYIHYLNLNKDPQDLFKGFRKKGVQYCIKKASKSEILVHRSTDLEALLTFYNLHLMTRKKLGVPTQPRKYFFNLWRDLIDRQLGFVILTNFNGKPVAGGIFLHFKKKLIYKYGATDPDYLNLYANHLLLWEVIKWGCENGFQVLDWGKTDRSNGGLRRFKLGWGTEEKTLVYTYIGKLPSDYTTGWQHKVFENAIRKSPVWVGRLLGNLLYRHVG